MWCKIESSFPSSWHLLTDSIHIHLWFRELILKDENETFWSSPKFQSTSLNSFFYMTAGCIAFNLSWRCSKCCGNVHFHPPKENRGDSFSRQGNNYLGYESRSVFDNLWMTKVLWGKFYKFDGMTAYNIRFYKLSIVGTILYIFKKPKWTESLI